MAFHRNEVFRTGIAIALTVVATLCVASPAAAQTVLTDPSGRYSVTIPAEFSGMIEVYRSDSKTFWIKSNERKGDYCHIEFMPPDPRATLLGESANWHDRYSARTISDKGNWLSAILTTPNVRIHAACWALDSGMEKLRPTFKAIIGSISVAD